MILAYHNTLEKCSEVPRIVRWIHLFCEDGFCSEYFFIIKHKARLFKHLTLLSQSSHLWHETTLWWWVLYDGEETASIMEIPSVLHKGARGSYDLDFSALRCAQYQTQRCSPGGPPQLHPAFCTRGCQKEAVPQTDPILLRNFVSWNGCVRNLPLVTTCHLVWTHSLTGTYRYLASVGVSPLPISLHLPGQGYSMS